MQLRENIRAYYFAHIRELSPNKQFHFCSRLAAWQGNREAIDQLRKLRAHFVPEPCTQEALRQTLQKLAGHQPNTGVNALQLREVYFNHYPQLYGISLALFRVRHLHMVYGIDARPALFELATKHALLRLKEQLLQDKDAVRFLSTYAVNYLYLLERVVLEHTSPDTIDVQSLYELGDTYDTRDVEQLQLLIYLYAHCIIAESNFYARTLTGPLLPVYTQMLQRIEPLIAEHFSDVSLDTKLEFLVCSRICSYTTSLAERIESECQASMSQQGTFIVDTHNSFASRSDKKDLAGSEHRNVLYIMSGESYEPHSTIVG